MCARARAFDCVWRGVVVCACVRACVWSERVIVTESVRVKCACDVKSCVRLGVPACVEVRVHARVRMCMRVCVYVCVCVRERSRVRVRVRAYVCVWCCVRWVGVWA